MLSTFNTLAIWCRSLPRFDTTQSHQYHKIWRRTHFHFFQLRATRNLTNLQPTQTCRHHQQVNRLSLLLRTTHSSLALFIFIHHVMAHCKLLSLRWLCKMFVTATASKIFVDSWFIYFLSVFSSISLFAHARIYCARFMSFFALVDDIFGLKSYQNSMIFFHLGMSEFDGKCC